MHIVDYRHVLLRVIVMYYCHLCTGTLPVMNKRIIISASIIINKILINVERHAS